MHTHSSLKIHLMSLNSLPIMIRGLRIKVSLCFLRSERLGTLSFPFVCFPPSMGKTSALLAEGCGMQENWEYPHFSCSLTKQPISELTLVRNECIYVVPMCVHVLILWKDLWTDTTTLTLRQTWRLVYYGIGKSVQLYSIPQAKPIMTITTKVVRWTTGPSDQIYAVDCGPSCYLYVDHSGLHTVFSPQSTVHIWSEGPADHLCCHCDRKK